MLHIEQISSSHFHRGLLNGCVGCRSVGQWGDGPGGLPTTLCIPGHLTRHRPTPARSESRCGPARTWCRVIDNCAVTQSFFSRNQHHYCFFFMTCSHISVFPTQHQTSRMSVGRPVGCFCMVINWGLVTKCVHLSLLRVKSTAWRVIH